MDRIAAMRVFARIVERRSFAQAARDLQIPRPTVTYAIRDLEALLGTRLLDRTTRHVSPTLEGSAYYECCIRLLADLDEVENAFRNNEPRGPLRVDLQGTLARHFVMPALPEFVAAYPNIEIRISEGDRMVDLVKEGVDCVLRAGELKDSSLVGRRVASFEQVTCASPKYLEEFGSPRSLEELSGHRMVAYMSSTQNEPYPLEFMDRGEMQLFSLAHTISVTGAEIYTAAALAGLGLVQIPRYRVAHQLKAGILCVVLPHFAPPPMPVSVLRPHNRHLSQRVRVFTDWLAAVFAKPMQDQPIGNPSDLKRAS